MSIISSSFLRKFNKDEKPFTPLVENNEKRKFLFSRTILIFWAITGHFGALIHTTKRFESMSRIWGIINFLIFITFCIITIEFKIRRDSASFASIIQLLLWIINDIWCYIGLIVNIWHFQFDCLCGKVQIEYNGFKNYIQFRNNIHQLNQNNIEAISRKEFICYIIILFISILLLNLLPFNSTWCDEGVNNYDYTINSIIFQSIVTIWNNICSLYAFDVTVLYVSLLHIQRFRNFRKQIIQNSKNNNIYNVRKQYYDNIVLNMKMSKKNWEFWVNGSFVLNALYVSFVIGIWISDKTQLWTWCHTNSVQISFVAGLSILRIMALVYPIARLNTEFHKIPMTIYQHIGWNNHQEIDQIYAVKKLTISRRDSVNNNDKNGQNTTTENTTRQRIGSYPPHSQNAAMIHHGYDSTNNSSILILPHVNTGILDNVIEEDQSVSMMDNDGNDIIDQQNNNENQINDDITNSVQTLILKQMMDNTKIQRFWTELTKYPLGIKIIGLRMEWGHFKGIFATGLAILFTVWLRSKFNVVDI